METRERILEAAVRVFGDHGFRGATTRRIAESAGVNEVTLFRHFGTKERLVREALSAVGSGGAGSSGPAGSAGSSGSSSASLPGSAPDALGVNELPERPGDAERDLAEWSLLELRRLHAMQAVLRSSMAEFEERPEVAQCGSGLAERTAEELTRYLTRLRERGFAGGDFDPAAAASLLMGALFSDAVSRDIMPARYPYDLERAAREYTRIFLRGIGVQLNGAEREGTK